MTLSQLTENKAIAITAFFIMSCLIPLTADANIPAAYLACEGAVERAPCALPGPQYGVCIRDTLCEDPPETSVNECVICVDECWASQDGVECIRPWTGEFGVCESQERCTDKIETSFEECRRCVEGTPWNDQMSLSEHHKTGCASQTDSQQETLLIFWWLHITICLIVFKHRSRWMSAQL